MCVTWKSTRNVIDMRCLQDFRSKCKLTSKGKILVLPIVKLRLQPLETSLPHGH